MKAELFRRRNSELRGFAYMITLPGIGSELYGGNVIKALMGKGFRHLRPGRFIEIEITAKVVKKGKK